MNEGDVVAAQKNATEGLDLRLGECSARGNVQRAARNGKIPTSLVRVSTSWAWSRVTFMNCGRVSTRVDRARSAQRMRRLVGGTSSKPRMTPSSRTCRRIGHRYEIKKEALDIAGKRSEGAERGWGR